MCVNRTWLLSEIYRTFQSIRFKTIFDTFNKINIFFNKTRIFLSVVSGLHYYASCLAMWWIFAIAFLPSSGRYEVCGLSTQLANDQEKNQCGNQKCRHKEYFPIPFACEIKVSKSFWTQKIPFIQLKLDRIS